MKKQFNCIGMGGTFDHLHRGHRAFIEFAAGLADHVVIGVTDHSMTQHKLFPQLIEPLTQRFAAVKEWGEQREISAEVVPLHDVFGPTIADARIDALAVTEETVGGGRAINAERHRLGLPALPIQVFQLVRDAAGKPITSTRIRAGEIDREGLIYVNILAGGITLTQSQRAFFAQPQGPIVAAAPSIATVPTYVVGDVCLANFHKNNWQFHAGWFDGMTERTPYLESAWSPNETVRNPAGGISQELIQNVQKVLLEHNKYWLNTKLPEHAHHTFVEGEEDLSALAISLLAHLGSVVYYGQPRIGMVKIQLSEITKQHLREMLAL